MTSFSDQATCPCGSGKKYKDCCFGKVEAIQKSPWQSEDQFFQIALQHHQAGRLPEAEAIYQRILQNSPNNADALHLSGLIAYQTGGIGEAVKLIRKALGINPASTMYFNLAAALKAQGDPDGAIESYNNAIQLNPDYAEAHNNLGNVYKQQGKLVEAAFSLHKAISLRPDYAEAHNNLGNVYKEQGRFEEATSYYRKALSLKPDYAEAYNNLGNVYREQENFDEAIVCYRKTLSLKPNSAETHNNLAIALKQLNQHEEAIASYQTAVTLNPNYAEAYNNLGIALVELRRHEEAVACYQKALTINPDSAETYHNAGNALSELQRHGEAIACYKKALALSPDSDFAYGLYLHSKQHCCDWEGIDDVVHKLLAGLDAGKAVSSPFPLVATPATAAQQKRCAEIYIEKKFPGIQPSSNIRNPYSHDRIRLGYFSSDFCNHASAYLMAELVEKHDRTQFEVIAFSFGASPNDNMRQRLSASFDRFLDVSNQSDQDIATLAQSLEIDIAINLKGFTSGLRMGIFALHPAPIQVNYLGCPGTMGAPYMDYLIADSTLIPAEQLKHYSEKIAFLPDSYQVNDSHRNISERQFTRSEVGLPEDGFVFCCFNSDYKITPTVFDIWMQLLNQVEGSVLWLLEGNALVGQNLRSEAVKRGIAPERIVFSRRMDLPDHLARHRLADLFLDTFYCNAHTTASDALWTGLPVLTYLGDTFAGRVAASLLNAIGLPELITHSHEEYKTLALRLATTPEELAAIKQKLALNRDTHPLFNTALFTRNIESAFTRMWRRHQDSLLPEHIYVEENGQV